MKPASVNEIKQALLRLPVAELTAHCLRLARYKKENKELLTYLLFEADDPDLYIKGVKEEMDNEFAAMNTTNVYYIKKTLRKILRLANRHIKYTGSKTAEAEVLLHFCTSFRALKPANKKSAALDNLYASQIKKIKTALEGMHEDLRYEYQRALDRLE
jgi:hypothetical protein